MDKFALDAIKTKCQICLAGKCTCFIDQSLASYFIFRLVQSVLLSVSASKMAFLPSPHRPKRICFMDKFKNQSFSIELKHKMSPSQAALILFVDTKLSSPFISIFAGPPGNCLLRACGFNHHLSACWQLLDYLIFDSNSSS